MRQPRSHARWRVRTGSGEIFTDSSQTKSLFTAQQTLFRTGQVREYRHAQVPKIVIGGLSNNKLPTIELLVQSAANQSKLYTEKPASCGRVVPTLDAKLENLQGWYTRVAARPSIEASK